MFASSNIIRAALLVGYLFPAVRSEIFNVTVGGAAGLKFTPETIDAQVGDQIRFIFNTKNHTVTQSTLANPCQAVPGGFDSGFRPVAADQTDGFPVAVLDIQNTDAIWAYCRQGTHCSSGMVFAVNPGDKMEEFKSAATGATPSGTSTPSSTSAGSTSSPSDTTATAGKDIKVRVGADGLTFTPASIQAAIGDTVTFEFVAKNHTVTQSTFEKPCEWNGGFDSGYQPVAAGSTNLPTYQIKVNDTKPIWAYCKQGPHCGGGMVFAVNAVESGEKNFAAYVQLAKTINGTAGSGNGSANPYGGAAISSRSFTGAGAALLAALISVALL
jgi:plastocyanin